MTALGEYFLTKSINRAEVAKKTRIAANRVNELTTASLANMKVSELVAISKAVEMDPRDLLEIVSGLKPR